MTLAGSARPETEAVFDPATYVDGVAFEALGPLRRGTPVRGVAGAPLRGGPAGRGVGVGAGPGGGEGGGAGPAVFLSGGGAPEARCPGAPAGAGLRREDDPKQGPAGPLPPAAAAEPV